MKGASLKKLIILFAVLTFMSLKTNAQIPNHGFEIWENYPDPENPNNVYPKPDKWVGLLPTSPLTYSFSIEKNLDNYPPGTGQYSLLIKSDITNGVNGVAFSYDLLPPGISAQNIPPAFPINYRPISLFLYYKYSPVDGDSMRVVCNLYKNGSIIGGFDYKSPQIVQSWTQLEIPISYNTSDIPDSATIILSTFCKIQHNGSMLYVDNLSFDNPITSTSEGVQVHLPKNFALMQNYPNPFNSITTIKFSVSKTSLVTIKLYNILGNEVAILLNEKKSPGDYEVEFNATDLPSGIYYYQMRTNSFKDTKKLILIK